MRLCFVAAPLIARSGVYNSATELVRAARRAGHDWSAVLGVSAGAGGRSADETGIIEFAAEPGGIGGVVDLSRRLMAIDAVRDADLVITLIPQSDMALSLTRRPWLAYLRGLPWPAAGEAGALKARVWRTLESLALRRAREVWATTPMLAREAGPLVTRLVAPGIEHPSARPPEDGAGDTFVWAARYSADKDPRLFLEAMRGSGLRGVMYGSGPLADDIRGAAPDNVSVPGWAGPDELWSRARAYVGTSSREAFGRSAVEAAMLGVPPLISAAFGCAEMLYTDPALARSMVVQSRDPAVWRSAIERLSTDDGLRHDAADHVRDTAAKLTMGAAVRSVDVAARVRL